MSFESMRRILSTSLQKSAISKEVQAAAIFEAARVALVALWGEERAALVRTVSFKEGSLKLATDSAPAKQQLSVDGARLKNEINRRLGSLTVRAIVAVQDGF